MPKNIHFYFSILAIISSLIVGLVFLITGIAKVIKPWKFIDHITEIQLLPDKWNSRAALIFIAFQCALGVALIFEVMPTITLPATVVLLVLLSTLTYWSTSTGRTEDCGCYTGVVDISPTQSLILNGFYILLLIVAWIFQPWDFTYLWQWMLVWATLTISYALANSSLVYLETTGSPYMDSSPIQPDRPWEAEWLGEEINSVVNWDSAIIVFLSPQCSHCKKWLNVLKVVHLREDLPEVMGVISLSSTTVEQGQEFVDSYDLNFPVGGVESSTINKLEIAGMPTAVLLSDGIIQEKWTGGMPSEFVERIRAGDLSYPTLAA